LNILAFFSETHPKQSQRDVSLQMYYCASSVSLLDNLDVTVLASLEEFPVVSNEMAMKHTGNWGNTMASSSMGVSLKPDRKTARLQADRK